MAKRNKPVVKHRKSGTQWHQRRAYQWGKGWLKRGNFCFTCWARHTGEHCPHCTVTT